MLKHHSKDIIFIVIILILIGIIWGVEKNVWIFIAINVLVIMICLLYINLNDDGTYEPTKKKTKGNHHYYMLKHMAETEIEEFLDEVDYDDFECIKKGKEILNHFSAGEDINGVVSKVKKVCSYDIEIYYLGLTAISMVSHEKLKEKDYDYIKIGIGLVNSCTQLKTKLKQFVKENSF